MNRTYFKIAERAAEKSDVKSIKVGACLVNGGHFKGWNTKKTHPLLPEIYGSTLTTHAEMKSILNAKDKSEGGILYVFRKDKSGRIKNSRPCQACLGFAIANGIRWIYYTIDETKIGIIDCRTQEWRMTYKIRR